MNELFLETYSNLGIDNIWKLNGFKDQDNFRYDSANEEDIKFLKRIFVNEIGLKRYERGFSFDFDNQFNELAIKQIFSNNKQVVAINIDFQLKIISRLRSYKGILSKELKEISTFIQEEVVIGDYSIIGSLLLVDSNNVNIILDKLFGDSGTCCFILSEDEDYEVYRFIRTLFLKRIFSYYYYYHLLNCGKRDNAILY